MQNFVVTTGKNLIDRDLNRSFSRVPNLSTDSRTVHLLYHRYVMYSLARSTHPINWRYRYFSFSIQYFQVWVNGRHAAEEGWRFLGSERRLTFRSTCRPSCECRRWKPVTLERIVDTIIRSRLYMVTCQYQLHSRQKTPACIYSRFDSRKFFSLVALRHDLVRISEHFYSDRCDQWSLW